MSYSEHVGQGHTWRRATSTSNGFCECGVRLPANLMFNRPLPRDQHGQAECAKAFDTLAEHGMIPHMPSPPGTQTVLEGVTL